MNSDYVHWEYFPLWFGSVCPQSVFESLAFPPSSGLRGDFWFTECILAVKTWCCYWTMIYRFHTPWRWTNIHNASVVKKSIKNGHFPYKTAKTELTWWFRTPSGTSGNDSVSVAIRFHWEYFPLWIRSACLQFVFESPAFWLRSGPGNRRIPILFTGNIFHYGLGPRACKLFSNRPHSDCVASYCVMFGALQAFLQWNHGAVIERRQSVLERVGGWQRIFLMCFETNVNSPVMLAVNWHWPLSSNRSYKTLKFSLKWVIRTPSGANVHNQSRSQQWPNIWPNI
jgi:hypothetical protein